MTEMIKRDLETPAAPEQIAVPQQRQGLHDGVARRAAGQGKPAHAAHRADRSVMVSSVFLAVLAFAAVVVTVAGFTGSSDPNPLPPQPSPSSDWTQLLTSPLSSAPPTPQRPGADWLRDLLATGIR